MNKKQLEKEADKWLRKYLLCSNCKRKCTCIQLNAYCEEQVLKAYVDSAEPREKRIADLEWQLQEVAKDNDIYQAESKRLEKENAELKDKLNNLSSVAEVRLANWQKHEKENKELKALIKSEHGIEARKNNRLIKQLTKAKEIIKKFLNAKSIEDTCVAESEAEQFLKED